MHSKLADVLFEMEDGNAEGNLELRAHLEGCADCREQLRELRATMALLDTWEAPEPNPYFLTRLYARLDEERAAAPASWPARVLAGLRARLVYGSRLTLRPVAAMAMTVIVLAGGGAYLGLSNMGPQQPPPQTAAVVHDLQTLDNNAQLLDQLETMSSPSDTQNNAD
jgi:hypothetical protein